MRDTTLTTANSKAIIDFAAIAGLSYAAHLYSDDEKAVTATKVAVTTQAVTSTVTLDVPLVANGGQAIWIEPTRSP